jgi:hypothetical protein
MNIVRVDFIARFTGDLALNYVVGLVSDVVVLDLAPLRVRRVVLPTAKPVLI